MRRMFKYTVPVDDQEHVIEMSALQPVLHVAAVGPGTTLQRKVNFWAGNTDQYPAEERTFRVFGTGQPIPDDWSYWGTTLDGSLVWHLFEKEQPHYSLIDPVL